MSRPKVIECGACGHPDYHCPASGCNHDELRDWAGREHLSASDHPVRRRARPAWLDTLPVETLPAEEIV